MKTYLDWSSYRDAGLGDAYADIPKTGGNFAKAVSVCINSRQCEAIDRGVMCPSFRVSSNPNLSPGGRVRLLKTTLNSDDVDTSLASAEIAEAMDLCVACKGCKRECENSVDMAMIKVEYLAQQNNHTKPSLRTRLIGKLSEHLHNYPLSGLLIKLRNSSTLIARLGEWLLTISHKRKVPQPIKQTCLEKLKEHKDTQLEHPLDEVVLFIDTFINNFSPDTGIAAKLVLERAGYLVHVARAPFGEKPLCCGRTHLANGLVDQAKSEAKRTLQVLLPHAKAGRRIIGLEPSCLLAIRDDYNFLELGDDAKCVASQALLFEEFIAREISSKNFQLELKTINTNGQTLLVHGHCHQKAVGAMKSMRKVLKSIPDLEFEFIEASCCGGAGSFCIEKEHADIAMQMAELSLFPALREQPDAPILANGFSCQQQIQAGVERDSTHLAELLLQASSGNFKDN